MTKNIRLCALDVDGTLVQSDLSLTESAARAVDSLRSAGIVPAIVTGRTDRELFFLKQRLPYLRYFVVGNGARAYDTATGETFHKRLLPLAPAEQIVRKTREFDVMLEIYADGVSYVDADAWENAARYGCTLLKHPSLGPARIPSEDPLTLLLRRSADIDKLNISFRNPADLPRLSAFCRGLPVGLTTSIQNGLEVNGNGVEKAAGLRALCARLGVAPIETAAVGDGLADVSMLRFSGFAVAMGSAQAPLRAHADWIAPDCNHDGIVRAIEKILEHAGVSG
jgi:Cof subfamily protein (haloacid dehalogenase superfamily)